MVFFEKIVPLQGESVVTIGNFDGFHLGHQRIVFSLREIARAHGLVSVILTFFPHPRVHLGHKIHLLSTDAQRREMLCRQDVDYIFFVPFASLIDLRAGDFIHDVLIGACRMRRLVVGEDFRFGRDRLGDIAFLRARAEAFGFVLAALPTLVVDGERVASSRIRRRLEAGDIDCANRLLGRPYFIDGTVEKGEGRGRKLGFPTINLRTENEILPTGVFQTVCRIGNDSWSAITHIGYRPTFAGSDKRVETHIPGFRGEIYGNKVRLSFFHKVRDEIAFADERLLSEQIARDIASLPFDK